jgi:hypothetical protein
MAQKFDSSELASFKELLTANSMQVDGQSSCLSKRAFSPKKNFSTN